MSRSQLGLKQSKYDCFYYIFWTSNPFATKPWWYIIISQAILRKDFFVVFKVQVKWRLKPFTECLSGQYLLKYLSFNLLQPSLVWGCIIMSQSVPRKDFFWPSPRSRSWWGLILSKYDNFDYIFSATDLLQSNLVWQYMVISWRALLKDWSDVFKVRVKMIVLKFALLKDWIDVFKVKVKVVVLKFIECLSVCIITINQT